MATEQHLIKELIRSKMIKAKREVERLESERLDLEIISDPILLSEWRGQFIMAQQLLSILEA